MSLNIVDNFKLTFAELTILSKRYKIETTSVHIFPYNSGSKTATVYRLKYVLNIH